MTDHHPRTDEALQIFIDGGEGWRPGDIMVSYAVDGRCVRGDRLANGDEAVEGPFLHDPTAANGDRADLNDARRARVESRGLRVQYHRIKREYRSVLKPLAHTGH